MTSAKMVSYAEVLDKALHAEYLEYRIRKDSATRRDANRNKGFHEGNKRKAHEGKSSGNEKRPKPPTPNGKNHNSQNNNNNNCNSHNNVHNHGNHKNDKVEYPNCHKCSHRHLGDSQEGTNKCYKCG
ncbi:uncharacterized protein LOC133823921 [Humulus lupulus]|uniref:uncharacterized protein LOC133823921 n=1 Tax=Humulus lupulus TaxID=3486 RepID=UPI002B412216|nr:uncharacterized protein LOC133823921 [Humulus lupulus]